jgi:hypothetical protein
LRRWRPQNAQITQISCLSNFGSGMSFSGAMSLFTLHSMKIDGPTERFGGIAEL